MVLCLSSRRCIHHHWLAKRFAKRQHPIFRQKKIRIVNFGCQRQFASKFASRASSSFSGESTFDENLISSNFIRYVFSVANSIKMSSDSASPCAFFFLYVPSVGHNSSRWLLLRSPSDIEVKKRLKVKVVRTY